MIQKANIFIAITPIHITNAESIASSYFIKDFNILLNPYNFNINNFKWDLIISGDSKMENDLSHSGISQHINSYVNSISDIKKFIKKVEREMPSFNGYNIFYTHLLDVLSNYMVFYFRRDLPKSLNVFEDGVFNYFIYEIKHLRFLKMIVKSITSRMLGVKYKYFLGEISGLHFNNVCNHYVRFPEKAKFKEKSMLLPFDKISYDANSNLHMILGMEPYISIKGKDVYRRNFIALLEKIIEIVPDYQSKKFYYKPHPLGGFDEAEKIAMEKGFNFTLIPKKVPIESVVADYKPSKIFSWESSALFNIQIALSGNTFVKIYSSNLFSTEMDELFKNVGIELI
jgi:hypothetical protein